MYVCRYFIAEPWTCDAYCQKSTVHACFISTCTLPWLYSRFFMALSVNYFTGNLDYDLNGLIMY